MKIKDFAKKQNVSVQAVYQKLKAAGIDISSIKDNNNGELTEEGLKICERLYLKSDAAKEREIKALNDQLNALLSENDTLKKTLEQKEKEIAQLTEARDRWASMAEAAQQTAQQAQALNMASIQALKAIPAAPRLTWWQRLTGKRIKAADPGRQPETTGEEKGKE